MRFNISKWWMWILSYSFSYVSIFSIYIFLHAKRGDDVKSAYGYFRNVLLYEYSQFIIFIIMFLSAFLASYSIFSMSPFFGNIFQFICRLFSVKNNSSIMKMAFVRLVTWICGFFIILGIHSFVFSIIYFFFYLVYFPFISIYAFYVSRSIHIPFLRAVFLISVIVYVGMRREASQNSSFWRIFLKLVAADLVGWVVACFVAFVYVEILHTGYVGWRAHVLYSIALFAGGLIGGVLSGWSLARTLLPESSVQRILPVNAEGVRNSILIPLAFHVGLLIVMVIVARVLAR